MNETTHESWWLASLGRTIVWARLREREAGTAEVFDSDGATLPYDSLDTARAALMDAEFVEFDGLDEDDALERGFSLDEVSPPSAQDDTAVRGLLMQQLGKRAGDGRTRRLHRELFADLEQGWFRAFDDEQFGRAEGGQLLPAAAGLGRGEDGKKVHGLVLALDPDPVHGHEGRDPGVIDRTRALMRMDAHIRVPAARDAQRVDADLLDPAV